MNFIVLIPARLASTRLPRKPLADIGGVPMVVRVAQRAAQSRASAVAVVADHLDIVHACTAHGVTAMISLGDHASGSDRLAEACSVLGIEDGKVVVNVQGDEPLIEPALIDACADMLTRQPDCAMSTVAHAIDDGAEFVDPNVVKVVLDARGHALYFSRAPIPWRRDHPGVPVSALRHVGLYAYAAGFLRRFSSLSHAPLEDIESLEQLRVLWHGERIAVHVATRRPGPGVDTPDDLARVRMLFSTANKV